MNFTACDKLSKYFLHYFSYEPHEPHEPHDITNAYVRAHVCARAHARGGNENI